MDGLQPNYNDFNLGLKGAYLIEDLQDRVKYSLGEDEDSLEQNLQNLSTEDLQELGKALQNSLPEETSNNTSTDVFEELYNSSSISSYNEEAGVTSLSLLQPQTEYERLHNQSTLRSSTDAEMTLGTIPLTSYDQHYTQTSLSSYLKM